MSSYFTGMDLHSNNTYYGIIDENGKKIYKAKLANDLPEILKSLEPYEKDIAGIVVESTYNWYWLVDGLMAAGYRVHLANPSAMKQYDGLKYVTDFTDAFHLANLLRLGILPEGYIYPKEQRPIRDLLRKRLMLVQQKTAHILSFESFFTRVSGKKIKSNEVKKFDIKKLDETFESEFQVLSAKANISVMKHLEEKIKEIEKAVLSVMELDPQFQKLLTVKGIGNILGLTIALETGDIGRFEDVGNYASYSRCVQSLKKSNGKKKGENNKRNGNKYLAWAFVEVANKSKRYCPYASRFFQRKAAKTNNIVATKALAHKLSRLSYHIMKNQSEYDPERAFGPLKKGLR